MKKLLIYFSLLVLSSLLCQAQDTLVLRDGQKMVVKIISFTNKVVYSVPPSDKEIAISQSKIEYIKYSDGTKFTIYHASESIHKEPYIVMSAGYVQPSTSSGFGASTYNPDPEYRYAYSGYANTGEDVSLTGGFKISNNGWELTGMVSYIRNGINATGVLNETMADFYLAIPNVYNLTAVGNYYYSNIPVLVGFTKNWGGNVVRVGMHMLGGVLITHTPGMTGDFTTFPYTAGNYTVPYSFSLKSQTQANVIFDMGFNLDITLSKQIFLRTGIDFELSGLDNHGEYEIQNLANGNVTSGTYKGSTNNPSSFLLRQINLSLGLGYKL